MQKIVLFDMDGTLTPAREHLDYNLVPSLIKLCNHADIGIVSGSDFDYIMQQCGFLTKKREIKLKLHLLPCNGTKYCPPPKYLDSDYLVKVQKDMKRQIGSTNFSKIMKILIDYQNHIVSHYNIPLSGHFISYRESMINWCPIGRNADLVERESFCQFDKSFGTSSFRRTVLQQLRQEFEVAKIPVTIKLGGVTSFDIYPDGWDKTYSLNHFPDSEIYFLGDRCGDNGNDKELYDVLQPKNSFWVKDTKDTKRIIEEVLIPRIK